MSKTQIQADLHDLAVDIADLILMDENPRLHPSASILAIRKSLREFKQTKPIVLASDARTVIAGNGTLLAAREEGFTEIAAVVSPFAVGSDEAKAYAIADNRVGDLSKFDIDIVEKSLGAFSKSLAEATGFSVDAFPDLSTAPEDPEPAEESTEPITESGAVSIPPGTSIIETTPGKDSENLSGREEAVPDHSLPRYDLTFSDDKTRDTFLDFVRSIRTKYPDIPTVGDRVVEFLRTEADGSF